MHIFLISSEIVNFVKIDPAEIGIPHLGVVQPPPNKKQFILGRSLVEEEISTLMSEAKIFLQATDRPQKANLDVMLYHS